MLPEIGALTEVACYLSKRFGKRLPSDEAMLREVMHRAQLRQNVPNTPTDEVYTSIWNIVQ